MRYKNIFFISLSCCNPPSPLIISVSSLCFSLSHQPHSQVLFQFFIIIIHLIYPFIFIALSSHLSTKNIFRDQSYNMTFNRDGHKGYVWFQVHIVSLTIIILILPQKHHQKSLIIMEWIDKDGSKGDIISLSWHQHIHD